MLNEILIIKRHRESKAEREVSRSRIAQAQAARAVQEETEALRTLEIEHTRREKAMYADLCARIVKLTDIQNVCASVAQMHEAQTRQDDVIHECSAYLAQCDEQLDQARQDLQSAMRKVEKYVQILATLNEEITVQRERGEETELEESANVIFGRHAAERSADN
ncbi:type III secretion system stalk subunit SctO [Pandoraea pnomenusa]|uniref:type III secretion system stalk subunit SctO n=1 Tax=Pandoraea pnomenusa TaxID=93220 RepID=UPI001AC95BB5|nr:YscO family type III secretion system apparatus protein [Pandoraea pnomenusa]MBN9096149.1 YscO family type III secretion system apparatus protein [Pandoraea pnomenusa]